TNPPHGVRNELHALVRIELPGSGEQSNVPFANQVDERQTAILVLLGDGDNEPKVALNEFLEGILITRANTPGERDLLHRLQQRVGADFVEILVENVSLWFTRSD